MRILSSLGLGLIVSLVGILVVFGALIVLYLIFDNLPKIINMNIRIKLRKQGNHHNAEQDDLSVEADVNAAIAAAISLYYSDVHDEESNIITIKNISKKYSPWSSKIYGVQNQPIKR